MAAAPPGAPDAPAPPGAPPLVVAVVSPASLGSQAAHEVESAVGCVARVMRTRSLAELFAWARRSETDAPAATVPLIIATDEVGSLDDVAAAVDHHPALAAARLVLLTERTELHDLGRAIDEDLVREVVAVPWTPGAIAHRAAAQTGRWLRDHLPDDSRRALLATDVDTAESARSPLLEALAHGTDALTAELIAACETVLGPRPRLRLPPGVRLTHQGQVVDGVYIVVSGAVALTRHTRVGEVTLHHATTGRIIGLVSLAGQGLAYVTSTTTTDVELILLSIEQLDRALRENPATEQALAALLIGSLTKRLSRSEILQVEKIELAAAVAAEKAQATEALAALEQARMELLAQERFATLGELAAGIAHELNNPVAALERAGAHLETGLDSVLASHPEGEAIARTAEAARTRPPASTRAERSERRALERVLGDRELSRRIVAAGLAAGREPADIRALAADPERLATLEAAASIGRAERNMRVATGRISGLVASLSTYVRPQGEAFQDVDVREVLEDALRLTAHRLHGVQIEREYPGEADPAPVVPAHPGELAQVWTNLLTNAADALAALAVRGEGVAGAGREAGGAGREAGGSAAWGEGVGAAEDGTASRPPGEEAAGAGREAGAGRLTLRVAQEPGAVRVEVEDNGPGIAPEVLPRIFEPRFTTKHGQVRFGLGLGMGLAKSVVDAHGGTIVVESRPGRTLVRVTLPTDHTQEAP